MTDDFSDAQKIEDLSPALRERAALAALTGLLANEAAFGPRFQGEWGAIVAASVAIADALVSRLKEGK